MLDSQKKQLTISILERMKKKGAPKLDVPDVLFPEGEDEKPTTLADEIQAVPRAPVVKRKKPVVP